ncbi:MAG: hypothetical protein KAX49_10940 [Halanaerobiales bacterium]|nr:hypothetical protein [Halanaerobiales bacterium]
MRESTKFLIIIGLIIVVVLMLRPAKTPPPNIQLQQNSTETVLTLGTNRIAIITTNRKSGNYGGILIFEYDSERNDLVLTGKFNYAEYIRNP